MKTISPKARKSARPLLTCHACGNTSRFSELMAEETHLVNGHLDYIHLVDAIVDHYVCCECGESLEFPDWAKPSQQAPDRNVHYLA